MTPAVSQSLSPSVPFRRHNWRVGLAFPRTSHPLKISSASWISRPIKNRTLLVCWCRESGAERSRADIKKGESCSLECSRVFVNIINHRLADGGANCTCGNNMTQRILLFTNVNWHFHQACHEEEREKMFNKLDLNCPNCHHPHLWLPNICTQTVRMQLATLPTALPYTWNVTTLWETQHPYRPMPLASDPQHLLHTPRHGMWCLSIM